MDASRTFGCYRFACARRITPLRAPALLAVLMLALAACATPPPPPPPTARQAHGVPAPRTRRVAPAPAPNNGDALAPADVGYYMDVLQGRLKQVAGTRIGIGRHGDRIVLDLTGRMAFGPGSTQLSAADHGIIASLSRVLVEYRMTQVLVRVRAADAATHAIDPRLSQQRAQAIANDLVAAGVTPRRIAVAGIGADKRVQIELSLEPIVGSAGSGR